VHSPGEEGGGGTTCSPLGQGAAWARASALQTEGRRGPAPRRLDLRLLACGAAEVEAPRPATMGTKKVKIPLRLPYRAQSVRGL
jgi:hypothetical protein